jgi:transposase
VDKQLRKQRDTEVQAWQNVCSTTLACEADAQQALATFAQGLQVTFLNTSTVRTTPRDGKRGRPGPGTYPDQVVYHIDGALAASLVVRQALVHQQSCVILATNELDETQLPPQEMLAGYQGQVHAERGFRFLKAPTFLAASRDLNKPERIMALFMVMTVC